MTIVQRSIGRGVGAVAVVLALGCSRALLPGDAGMTGAGGGMIMTGGAGATGLIGTAGAGGATRLTGSAGISGGGAGGAAADGGPDPACGMTCGRVEGIVSTDGNCTYVLRCPGLLGDFTRMFVFVDGMQVPMDATGTDGWAYTDASMSAFRLYGQACADATGDAGFVDITLGCPIP